MPVFAGTGVSLDESILSTIPASDAGIIFMSWVPTLPGIPKASFDVDRTRQSAAYGQRLTLEICIEPINGSLVVGVYMPTSTSTSRLLTPKSTP